MSDYDVIVVGTGAGGGTAACVLAEAGKRVLLLERGHALSYEEDGRDHLRNQRISLYGHNAGPDIEGNPRVSVDTNLQENVVRPHEGGYHNNAATVGGGTRVYGAQAWRFMEQDFRMASIYGCPEGSSLADWPLTYQELEPYYEHAEWELGVAGDGAANRNQAPRNKDYPMPPVPPTKVNRVLSRGAESLGWNTFPTPLAINTVEREGRPACIQCCHCVGFACPSDSKNGTQNTFLPRAINTGLCDLVTGAMVEKVDTNPQGKVIGVVYLKEENGSFHREWAKAKQVVLAAGAIETARLLLLSANDKEPNGIGNAYDQVGRNMQGHYYPGAHGMFGEEVWDGQGPGVSISMTDFNHGNPGIIGGGMLSDEFIKLPIIFWYRSLPSDIAKWGKANKDWMRNAYRRTVQVMGPVQDIPSPEARVTLAPDIRDRYGIRVARLSGTTHPETLRTSEFMRQKAIDWLERSGAIKIWGNQMSLSLSGGQHQAGTCRMGNDPQTSVTDRWGRIHNHDNLFVADASLHVTNGGFNPFLTAIALAYRTAEYVATL